MVSVNRPYIATDVQILLVSYVLFHVALRYALRFRVRVSVVVRGGVHRLLLRPTNSDGQCAPVSDWLCVSLSVCMSVSSRHCIKTIGRIELAPSTEAFFDESFTALDENSDITKITALTSRDCR